MPTYDSKVFLPSPPWGGLLLAAALVSGCFLQPLDLDSVQGLSGADAGLTTRTMTPPIQLEDGATTYSSCAVTSAQANAILEKYCARCHSGRNDDARRGQPPFDFLFDVERMKSQTSASVADLRDPSKKMRFVVPGDADNSRVYFRVSRGEMPPTEVMIRPTVSDFSLLRQWITTCIGAVTPP